ncbi:Hypothetical protein, putative [Bodo saltans]|uniref:Uncharacterized protein n=1 Tax=Bodo saltans TaxID=75058 RepID=A0A0S4JKP4_BODSA|nr:Hypothetical protein, putative [Bodo saltans]|eukprot:CUG91168.1 Hypothetical protein, putative [Bodo saltans]
MGAACCGASSPSPAATHTPPARPPVSPLMVSDEGEQSAASLNNAVANAQGHNHHHTLVHGNNNKARPFLLAAPVDAAFGEVVPEQPTTPNMVPQNPLRPPAALSRSNDEEMLQDSFTESGSRRIAGGGMHQQQLLAANNDFLAVVSASDAGAAANDDDEFARTVVPPPAAASGGSTGVVAEKPATQGQAGAVGGRGKRRKSSLVPPKKMSMIPPGSTFQSVLSRGNIPLADAVPNGELTGSTSTSSLMRASTRPVLLDKLRPNEFTPPIDEEARRRQSVPLPARSPRRRMTTMFTPDGSGDDVSFKRSHRGSTSTTATTSSLLSQNSGTHFLGGLWHPTTPQQQVV